MNTRVDWNSLEYFFLTDLQTRTTYTFRLDKGVWIGTYRAYAPGRGPRANVYTYANVNNPAIGHLLVFNANRYAYKKGVTPA